eukprot:157146-Chlamydomonas_euryale.AAC.9
MASPVEAACACGVDEKWDEACAKAWPEGGEASSLRRKLAIARLSPAFHARHSHPTLITPIPRLPLPSHTRHPHPTLVTPIPRMSLPSHARHSRFTLAVEGGQAPVRHRHVPSRC